MPDAALEVPSPARLTSPRRHRLARATTSPPRVRHAPPMLRAVVRTRPRRGLVVALVAVARACTSRSRSGRRSVETPPDTVAAAGDDHRVAAAAACPRRRRRPKPRPKPQRADGAPPAPAPRRAAEPAPRRSPSSRRRADRRGHRRPGREPPTEAVAAEPASAAARAAARRRCRRRVDLVYKAFLGTQGFLIGEAIYRFEHAGNDYRIATSARRRGSPRCSCAARARSKAAASSPPTGLQPLRIRRRARQPATGARPRSSTGRPAS